MGSSQKIWAAVVKTLRPLHWIKSGFCLAALFLGGAFLDFKAWVDVLPVVVGFSLLSSSGYVWNDLCNVEQDRWHPKKRHRPIAAGELSAPQGVIVGVVCAVTAVFSLWATYDLGKVFFLGLSYLAISGLYNHWLREIPFVDVLVLSVGFVVRVAAGAFAIGAEPSWAMLIFTYSLAMLLGFGKRRGEMVLLRGGEMEPGATRESLRDYSLMLLDVFMSLSALSTILAYIFYAFDQESVWALISVAPVVVGIAEYLRWAARSDKVEVPEKLIGRSPVLATTVCVWLVLVVVAGL